MNRQSIEEVLTSPRLPTLPMVAMQVLEVTERPEVNLQEVAMLVRNDQALATKILRTVNSSYYALLKPCTTIHDAMVYLGLSTVKTLVLGFGLVDGIRGDDHESAFNYRVYWRRGLYAAIAAKETATMVKTCDPEEAFLAALMQDIGLIVLYRVFDEVYLQILDSVQDDHRRLPDVEMGQLGLDHVRVGAEVAAKWKLPEPLVQAVRFHHDSSQANEQWRNLARTVELSAHAATGLMREFRDDARAWFVEHAGEWFGLDEARSGELLEKIGEGASELVSLFHLDDEDTPDVEGLLRKAEDQLLRHQIEIQRESEELKQANVVLAKQATTDPLTGLANRMHFDKTLREAFEGAQAWGGCLGLIFGDVDKFKSVNDTHGHQVGDVVLASVTRVMRDQIGDYGTVCRYGGEEFAIIIPGTNRVQTAKMAETLRRAIATEIIDISGISEETARISVTVSLGVAALEPQVREAISQPELLIRLADQAVYVAKASGRNCVRVFSFTNRGNSAA